MYEAKFELPPAGIGPWSLFLSNRSSWRNLKFPSSGGSLPVNPLDCKFLQECKQIWI